MSAGENFSVILVKINNDIFVYRLGVDLAERYKDDSNDTVKVIVSLILLIIIE